MSGRYLIVIAALLLSGCAQPDGEIVRVCHTNGQIVRKHGRLYARVDLYGSGDTPIAADAKLDEICRP